MSDYQMHAYDTDMMVPATGAERIAAAACHGAFVFALPFVLPLIIYFLFPIVQPQSVYVRHQALQAGLYHLFVFFIGTVLFGIGHVFLLIPILGWPFAAFFYLLGAVFCVWAFVVMFIATMRAFQGRPYKMPLVGNWGR
jgi:uncharacterized membrane protein